MLFIIQATICMREIAIWPKVVAPDQFETNNESQTQERNLPDWSIYYRAKFQFLNFAPLIK